MFGRTEPERRDSEKLNPFRNGGKPTAMGKKYAKIVWKRRKSPPESGRPSKCVEVLACTHHERGSLLGELSRMAQ